VLYIMGESDDKHQYVLSIREFRPEDIRQIRNLARLAFESEVDRYWSVVGAQKAPYTYIAEINGNIVGVIEFEPFYLPNSVEGHIWYIFVHPEYQRRGIGTALLRKAEGILSREGAKRVWAITSPDNIKTRLFFEKNGYRRIPLDEMKKLLGSTNTKKFLRRMVYFEGDIIYMKVLM